MLAIKLKPIGKKHQKTYRIIVAERRSKLNGRFVDDLGWSNPHTDAFNVNAEATKKWIANGAQPTPSVHNLLVRAGVIDAPKIPVHAVSKKEPKKEDAKPVEKANPAEEMKAENDVKQEKKAEPQEETKPVEEVVPVEETKTEEVKSTE